MVRMRISAWPPRALALSAVVVPAVFVLATNVVASERWLSVGTATGAWAGEPVSAKSSVAFDVDRVVGARNITTEADRFDDPGGRRMQVVLPVSVLLPPDSPRDLVELLVRVESPYRLARVVDFAPRTLLESEGAGPVRVERKEESQRNLDFQLRGVYPALADGHVKGNEQSRTTTESTWEQMPELELCVASGAVNRGHGVYFKFKPTKRSTLEGTHALTIELRVPAGWRGDCLVVRCSGYSRETTLVGAEDRPRLWAERSFFVALHELGDERGRAAAETVMRAEAKLRGAVLVERRRAESSWSPEALPGVGRIFGSGDERTGVDAWWEAVILGVNAPGAPVSRPGESRTALRGSSALRAAATNFQAARQALIRPEIQAARTGLARLPSVEEGRLSSLHP